MEVYDFFEDELEECQTKQTYVLISRYEVINRLVMLLLLLLLFGLWFVVLKRNVWLNEKR